jgi:hypothetical protein
MDMDMLADIKRATIRRIKAMVKPHLHSSGYVHAHHHVGRGNKLLGSLQLCHFGTDEEGDRNTIKVKAPVSLDHSSGEIEGFTSYGIIEDSWGGGLVTRDYSEVALEDLQKIEALIATLPATAWQ